MKIVESMKFEDIPSILVFNKTDKADAQTEASLREGFPLAPLVSAKNGKNFKELFLHIEKSIKQIKADPESVNFILGEKPGDATEFAPLRTYG